MQRYISVFVAVSLLLLVSCQTNPVGSTMFSPFPSSMTLAQSVQEELMRNDELAVSRIHVETNQNTVILSGYVKKIRQSDMAEQIARQVPGVQTVQNNIIVRP